MELSTQILMFDAIQQGIKIEILDRQDQFLKLKLKDHVEYVKNGNMTSKDNYVSTLIMENKTVTKKILHQHGFRVPKGEEFQTVEQAFRSYRSIFQQTFCCEAENNKLWIRNIDLQRGRKLRRLSKSTSISI